MRLGLRTPFFGMPEDREILGEDQPKQAAVGAGEEESGTIPDADPSPATPAHGQFYAHNGENRTQRRAAVATWEPPKDAPTRRELWLQRQRQRRGKLDIETRRLQRKATK